MSSLFAKKTIPIVADRSCVETIEIYEREAECNYVSVGVTSADTTKPTRFVI
jgi:hypothetical protein